MQDRSLAQLIGCCACALGLRLLQEAQTSRGYSAATARTAELAIELPVTSAEVSCDRGSAALPPLMWCMALCHVALYSISGPHAESRWVERSDAMLQGAAAAIEQHHGRWPTYQLQPAEGLQPGTLFNVTASRMAFEPPNEHLPECSLHMTARGAANDAWKQVPLASDIRPAIATKATSKGTCPVTAVAATARAVLNIRECPAA